MDAGSKPAALAVVLHPCGVLGETRTPVRLGCSQVPLLSATSTTKIRPYTVAVGTN